jgi:predicted ferric reductase
VAFPNIKEASGLGYDLCLGLHNYCKSNGIDSFELKQRFSGDGTPRWDQAWIEKQLAEGPFDKIWACGPPVLNESFERALSALVETIGWLTPLAFEVL